MSIEEVEGVWEIKVGLEGKSILGIFELILLGDLLLETSNKLRLVIYSHRRSAARAGSSSEVSLRCSEASSRGA